MDGTFTVLLMAVNGMSCAEARSCPCNAGIGSPDDSAVRKGEYLRRIRADAEGLGLVDSTSLIIDVARQRCVQGLGSDGGVVVGEAADIAHAGGWKGLSAAVLG
jgi:hypothetical protein